MMEQLELFAPQPFDTDAALARLAAKRAEDERAHGLPATVEEMIARLCANTARVVIGDIVGIPSPHLHDLTSDECRDVLVCLHGY